MISKKKVYILEPIDGMEETINILEENNNIEVYYGPPVSNIKNKFTEDQLIKNCKDVHAIMGMAREKITRRVIESCPKLEVICKYGIGVDNIDIQAATDHGVLVANAPVHNSTVAETAFTLILSVLKKIPQNTAHLKMGFWRDSSTMGSDLSGKTIGILGFGTIGKELAKRLQGWGVKILVFDPNISDEVVQSFNGNLVDKDVLLSSSDIISIHMPLINSTYKFLSKREFKKMKSNAVIINTSRGKIIDEEELINALKQKEIGGAGLDVFYSEPLSLDSPLFTLENVVMTPHVAGYTFEALQRISKQSSINCLNALQGNIPEFTINIEAVKMKK